MNTIKINPADNVAVAIENIKAGESVCVDGCQITVNNDIPAGHKFLLKDLEKGEDVIKYGYPIGHLIKDQKKGDFVNHENIKTNLSGLLDYSYNPINEIKEEQQNTPIATFKGYRRKNGNVGVRNELWIIPTVGCVNGVCNQLCECLKHEVRNDNIRIIAFPHNYGCSQLSDDHENTRKILRDMALHPNAGAVLIVGLGCENNQPDEFMKLLGDYDKERIRLMVTQKVEGDEIEEGMKIL